MLFFRRTLKRILRRMPFYFGPGFMTSRSVIWAYRLFLDRNPENRAVIREKMNGPIGNLPDLRRDMVLSDEFARKNPDLAPFPPGSVVIKELSCGLKLYIDLSDAGIGAPIARGNYENDLVEMLPKLVEKGAIVLDIGANIGYFSLHLADAVGSVGRVIAFEPIAEAVALLKKSIGANNLSGVIKLEESAVGEKTGTTDILFVHNARNQGASYLVTGETDCRTSHEVRCIPVTALDDYDFAGKVSFIKIDIEGAEPLCMRGAKRLLERDRPVVMSELHPAQLKRVSNAEPGDYLKMFTALNYRCYRTGDSQFELIDENQPIGEIINALFVPEEKNIILHGAPDTRQ